MPVRPPARPDDSRPLVAIACGIDEPNVRTRRAYADAVLRAGGLPVLLAPPPADHEVIAESHIARCDALILTGGADPVMEGFGEATHPMARRENADRQRFDLALLGAAGERPELPVLGVCLGMQLMALHAGGSLIQHMPEEIETHADHLDDNVHEVFPAAGHPLLARAGVASWHHQAVREPGRLRVAARAHDDVIEAIDDPARAFYLGVQWHPERTSADAPGDAIFRALVAAAR